MVLFSNRRLFVSGLASAGLVLAMAATFALSGCSDDDDMVTTAAEARLIKVIGTYNVVRFNGYVYGAPHGIAIDWHKDNLKEVRGMVVGTSVEAVEKSIGNLPPKVSSIPSSPNAVLVKVISRYNIVKFKDNVYGAPHGVAIDWDRDDLNKVDGMIVGSSVFGVQVSVIGRLLGQKVLRLGDKVLR